MEWVAGPDEEILYGVPSMWVDHAVYLLQEAGIAARSATPYDPEDPAPPRSGLLERDTGGILVPKEQVPESLALLRAWSEGCDARVKQQVPNLRLDLARVVLVLGLGYLFTWFVSGRWHGVARHAVVVGVMLGVGVLGEFVRYRRRSRK